MYLSSDHHYADVILRREEPLQNESLARDRKITSAFQSLFNKENPDARIVLEYLSKYCGYDQERCDPGRRSVFLEIKRRLKKTVDITLEDIPNG